MTEAVQSAIEKDRPRQPRLDATGTPRHVMSRGIEASKIFTKKDREDFIDRLAELCRAGSWAVYAWALMPNHFHLVRTGKEYLARSMRRLMTGYAINFNLRNKRRGHFFRTATNRSWVSWGIPRRLWPDFSG